ADVDKMPPDEVLEDPEVPLASQEPEPDMEEPMEPEDPDEIVLEDPEVPLASLPQTGQLWWPVPMLAMGGMISLLLGLIRNRRSQDDEG
ncbi:MAG: LPXTG cell wall anchor domain-containing protein, partial [Oscillospiraceae bacterium]|nr:LPXTG cell wall anchor domain-containing protein [Oscillospiraceae bacterium]